MDRWLDIIVAVVLAFIASSGFWTFVLKKSEKNNADTKLLIGLAHNEIMKLGMSYIERGWITQDEYENLHDYLYVPYENRGGNGSAKRVMLEVEKLPIHSANYQP